MPAGLHLDASSSYTSSTMSSSAPVEEGQILAGKYRVDKILGQGGMGVVVAARHIGLDEPVAIKFLLPEVLENKEAVERFGREARASIKIKSEHVVRVMDVGTMEGGMPYMVMEYLKGGDLSQLLQSRGGPLTVSEACEYLLQACEAIADAHALGIVHRDLKPANLFLTQRTDGTPCVKVLDFGISKMSALGASGLQMTKTSTVMGSPLYMSPEQMASSKDVDPRSDIWSLGSILYELLTGTTPFMAETLPQVCAMILQSDPVPIHSVRPDVPEGLEKIAYKCLAKRREDRFQNVAELAVALADFAPRHARTSAERVCRVLSVAGVNFSNTAMPPSSVPANAVTGPGMTAANWSTSTGTKTSSSKTAVIAGVAIAAVVFAGLGVGGVILFGRSSARATASGVVDPTSAVPVPSETAPVASVTAPPTAPSGQAPGEVASASPPPAASPSTGGARTPPGPVAKQPPPTGNKQPPTGAKQPPPGGRGLDLFNDNK